MLLKHDVLMFQLGVYRPALSYQDSSGVALARAGDSVAARPQLLSWLTQSISYHSRDIHHKEN